jgi:hypothetical protein
MFIHETNVIRTTSAHIAEQAGTTSAHIAEQAGCQKSSAPTQEQRARDRPCAPYLPPPCLPKPWLLPRHAQQRRPPPPTGMITQGGQWTDRAHYKLIDAEPQNNEHKRKPPTRCQTDRRILPRNGSVAPTRRSSARAITLYTFASAAAFASAASFAYTNHYSR